MQGVYCIEHIDSGTKYIGSSNNIQQRWREHKSHLRRNKHVNRWLQRAWNKYGEDTFVFSVVYECNDVTERITVEQHLLNEIKENGNTYNMLDCVLAPMYNKETVDKMRDGVIKSWKEKRDIYMAGLQSSSNRERASKENRKRWQNTEYKERVKQSLREAWVRRKLNKSLIKEGLDLTTDIG